MTNIKNTPSSQTPQMRRRNIALALVLALFAASLAASVFIWRYAHNQPAIPQGGSYGATYEIQK
ncbi:MAG: hypothetical protein DI628_01125 [Blastochloris viridis]|uniref:Uncharacterized protein n=1 Tax=Blastochloris viridis TaxID=1079 RepID=A0A6N4R316_BLAVI|nr:MAG: hypothetical protein DI628_01125 [Blastochloris viridis]